MVDKNVGAESVKTQMQVRQMAYDDIPSVLRLEHIVFEGMPGWTPELLQHHMTVFPEGQLVVENQNRAVLGYASTLIIDWDDYSDSAKWSTITAGGTFDSHNPLGKTLYGAELAVDPAFQRQGIGTLLYNERKKLIKRRDMKRFLTGGRIAGYAKVAHLMTPHEYVAEVIAGKRKDQTLNFQLANGLVVLDVVPNYLLDSQSRGFATLLEWLNPEYLTSISLHADENRFVLLENARTVSGAQRTPRRVRIATMQYLLRPINRFADFAAQVEFFVQSAKDYHCHFILFPELFTMQLLSYLREPAPARAVRRLAQLTSEYENLFQRLARETGIYIIAGTHPIIDGGQLFNAAHLFTPNARIFRQKKVHLTQPEKGPYQMARGHGFNLFHTAHAKIAIQVCYDIEFPEAARAVAEVGAEILFVPCCTDERQGFCRVRYCSQSRAIENQIYVVMACTVGNLPQVPYMATNYGQAAILTPSDYLFARDGIASEGIINQEQMIVADVDLDLLDEQRINGTVIPLNDVIKDAYDRVIQSSDLSNGEEQHWPINTEPVRQSERSSSTRARPLLSKGVSND